MHDELPRAGRQGDPRGDRHPPRLDHDAARHDEHADGRGRAAQGSASRPCGVALADPDDDRLGDGDRADLSRARGPPERARRARSAAERLADRLRLRGRTRRRRSTRSTGCCAPRPTGRSRASSATRSGRSSPSTTRTTRARRSSTRSSTMVVNGTQVKVLAWYDNEWGYANRLVELAALVGATASTAASTRAPAQPRAAPATCATTRS